MVQLKLGDRIRLICMPLDPDPIPVGSLGTVLCVHEQSDWSQVEVAWDNGRTLMLTVPPDQIQMVSDNE